MVFTINGAVSLDFLKGETNKQSLDPYLTSYPRINLGWITNPNTKEKNIKFLGENIRDGKGPDKNS